MNNIVDFGTGRTRPRRSIQVAEDGAQILFFTGVRYMRDEDDAPSFVPQGERFCDMAATTDQQHSAIAFELTSR